jgi:hypothetical protein
MYEWVSVGVLSVLSSPSLLNPLPVRTYISVSLSAGSGQNLRSQSLADQVRRVIG